MNFGKSFLRSVHRTTGQGAFRKKPHTHFDKTTSSESNVPARLTLPRSIALGLIIGASAALGLHVVSPPNFHLLPPLSAFPAAPLPGPQSTISEKELVLIEMGQRIRDLKIEIDELIRRSAADLELTMLQSQHACIRQLLDELAIMESRAWETIMELAGPCLQKSPQVRILVEENAGLLQQLEAPRVVLDKIISQADDGDLGQGGMRAYIDSGPARKRNKQLKAARALYDKLRSGIRELAHKIDGGEQLLGRIERLEQVAAQRTVESDRQVQDTMKELFWIVTVLKEIARTPRPPTRRPGHSSVGEPL